MGNPLPSTSLLLLPLLPDSLVEGPLLHLPPFYHCTCPCHTCCFSSETAAGLLCCVCEYLITTTSLKCTFLPEFLRGLLLLKGLGIPAINQSRSTEAASLRQTYRHSATFTAPLLQRSSTHSEQPAGASAGTASARLHPTPSTCYARGPLQGTAPLMAAGKPTSCREAHQQQQQ